MDKSSHFLFFADDLTNTTVTLDNTESRHAASVLRIQPGEELRLTDGKGCLATGKCQSAGNRNLTVSITCRSFPPPPAPEIHLCAGLPEREAFEILLTNATALRVTRIIPVVAEYCQKKWWDNWDRSEERFRQKMITALKQSHNVYLPELSRPCSVAEACEYSPDGIPLVADPSGAPLHELTVTGRGSIVCFIGPPGGFSNKEVQLLTAHSGKTVRIAPARLRTELAATVLCAQILGASL